MKKRKLIKELKRIQVPSMLFDYVASLEIPDKKKKAKVTLSSVFDIEPIYWYDPTKFDIEKKLEMSRETNVKLHDKIYFLEREKEDLQKRYKMMELNRDALLKRLNEPVEKSEWQKMQSQLEQKDKALEVILAYIINYYKLGTIIKKDQLIEEIHKEVIQALNK